MDLATLKDILISVAAVVTSCVAVKGLFIWRDQLKGTDKYKLSKAILTKTYNLQDSIMSVRTPFVSSGELSQRESDMEIKENETQQEKMSRNEAYALWKRTEPMFKTVAELKVSKFEAMALFGKDSVEDINDMIRKAYELRNAQISYFQMKINPSIRDQKSMDENWQTVYEMPIDKDSYRQEVDGIASKIENRFRIYLK